MPQTVKEVESNLLNRYLLCQVNVQTVQCIWRMR